MEAFQKEVYRWYFYGRYRDFKYATTQVEYRQYFWQRFGFVVFAGIGDVIIAEPKALIGFTGPRVIEQTIRQKLPEGFQKSEFLLAHGLIDMIVERKDLHGVVDQIISYSDYSPAGA